MSREPLDRRTAIRLGAGAAATALFAGRASAQDSEMLNLLGEIASDLLPQKPLNLVRMVADILELEKKANAKALPLSPLDAIRPPPLLPVEGSFYQSAVPRLVTLIDRNEKGDPQAAEEAGALLAQVNANLRTVPDALKPAPLVMSTRRDFPSLKAEYRQLFDTMTPSPAHAESIAFHTALALEKQERYATVGSPLKVPWFFIAAIHNLEASCNFRAHLHNGDFPLSQRTRQVPAGRPAVWLPPSDWASSATDALKLLGFANQTDWSLERTLYRLEAYNGFGYRRQKVPSPYLWCMSNHYSAGKYVADGKWSATAKSRQLGAAVLIRSLVDGGHVKLG
jgi:lysozyme family protein